MDAPPAELQVTVGRMNGYQVITVTGEIDISTAPALNSHLLTACVASGQDAAVLVVDLSAVSFMDAAGLTVLLRADRRARRTGGRLRLAAPTGRVARLLAITELNLHFDLHPTSEAATAGPGRAVPDTLRARADSRPGP